MPVPIASDIHVRCSCSIVFSQKAYFVVAVIDGGDGSREGCSYVGRGEEHTREQRELEAEDVSKMIHPAMSMRQSVYKGDCHSESESSCGRGASRYCEHSSSSLRGPEKSELAAMLFSCPSVIDAGAGTGVAAVDLHFLHVV